MRVRTRCRVTQPLEEEGGSKHVYFCHSSVPSSLPLSFLLSLYHSLSCSLSLSLLLSLSLSLFSSRSGGSRTQSGRQTDRHHVIDASSCFPTGSTAHIQSQTQTETETQTQTHTLLLHHHIAHHGRVTHGPNVGMCCQKFSNVSVLMRHTDQIHVQPTFQNFCLLLKM